MLKSRQSPLPKEPFQDIFSCAVIKLQLRFKPETPHRQTDMLASKLLWCNWFTSCSCNLGNYEKQTLASFKGKSFGAVFGNKQEYSAQEQIDEGILIDKEVQLSHYCHAFPKCCNVIILYSIMAMCMQFLTLFAKKYPNKGPRFFLALEWMYCWYKMLQSTAYITHIFKKFDER